MDNRGTEHKQWRTFLNIWSENFLIPQSFFKHLVSFLDFWTKKSLFFGLLL